MYVSFKTYFNTITLQGQGQYTKSIKAIEDDIQTVIKLVNELTGIKESDTGLAPPALWDLAADKQTLQNEQPLQVSIRTFNDLYLIVHSSIIHIVMHIFRLLDVQKSSTPIPIIPNI